MTINRMLKIIHICLLRDGFKRAEYLKKKHTFAHMGDKCFWQPRNIPPEAELIRIGNNVVIASEVLFVNHDVMNIMFNGMEETKSYAIHVGAIEIGDNVFIGSRCIILPGTKIENNVIIGAGAVVTGLLEQGGVYAGVPAKRIGEFDVIMKSRKNTIPTSNKHERFEMAWKNFRKKYGDES